MPVKSSEGIEYKIISSDSKVVMRLMDIGETVTESIQRDAFEETGLTIKNGHF